MARLETPPPDDARLPGFEWVPNDFNSGGTYTHRRWRIVLHRTDTLRPSTAASARAAAAAHPNPPHIWFGWAFNGEEIADQTIRLDRSARALRTAGGRSFNKDGALQVELWDKAAPSVELPDWQLRRIAEAVVVPLARWAEAHGSTVELATRPLPGPGLAAGRYGETAPHRMGIPEWDSPSAERVLAHYDPPGQTHWDTGTLDVARLVAHAIDIMNGDDMPLTADDLAAIAAVVDARVAAQLASVVTPRFNWEENVLRTHVTDREDVALPDGTVATNRARAWAFPFQAIKDMRTTLAADTTADGNLTRADVAQVLAAVQQLSADIADGVTVNNEVTVTTLPPEVLDQIRAVLVSMLAGGISGLEYDVGGPQPPA